MPKIEDRLKRGKSFRSNNLLTMKWSDKKEVYIFSTMHTAEFAEVFKHRRKKVVQKSVCVINYNSSMDIVDNGCFSFSDISRHKHLSFFQHSISNKNRTIFVDLYHQMERT